MDFVERYLHISPDGGSGATEAIYIAVVVLIALAPVLRRELRKHPPGTAAADWGVNHAPSYPIRLHLLDLAPF